MTIRTVRAPTHRFDTITVEGVELISPDGVRWVRVNNEFVDNSDEVGGDEVVITQSVEGTSETEVPSQDAVRGGLALKQDTLTDYTPEVWNGKQDSLPDGTDGQVLKWSGGAWNPGTDEQGSGPEGGLTAIDTAQLWFLGTRGTAVNVTVGGVDTTSTPFTRIGTTLHFIRGVQLNADSTAFEAGRGLWSETSTPTLTNSRNLIG